MIKNYTIEPIEGMGAFQKNFASFLKNGDAAAINLLQTKKLTLARRFQLIERGFVLKLKEEPPNPFEHIETYMRFWDKKTKEPKSKENNVSKK